MTPQKAATARGRGWRELLSFNRRNPTAAGLVRLARRARDVERATGLRHSGLAAICCRVVSGPVFAAAREAVGQGTTRRVRLVHWELDVNGNQWALLASTSLDRLALAAMETEVTLEGRGFGGLLEWTVFGLRDGAGQPLHLVYSHRSDRFHPFAPRPGQERDAAAEQVMATALDEFLPMGRDPALWTPLWGVPVDRAGEA